MTEQNLNDPQISTGIEQVGGKGVTQDVRTDVFLARDLLAQSLKDLPNSGLVHRNFRLLARKQPIGWLSPAPVDPEQLEKLGREHDLARKSALAFSDVNDHTLAIDVADLELLRFGATQSRAVERCDECTVLRFVASSKERTSSRLNTVGNFRQTFGLATSASNQVCLRVRVKKNFSAAVRT